MVTRRNSLQSTVEDGVVVASRKDAFGRGYLLSFDRSNSGERVLKKQLVGGK